jgi:hypothetical protein
MKGLIFAGCSFTWGQGLYYYSKLETLKEPAPDSYDAKLVRDAHKRYMETIRYPRLVASHFKTWEVVSKQNGGSEETSLCFIRKALGMQNGFEFLVDDSFSFEEIEYVIIQTSQPNRNGFYYKLNGEDKKFGFHDKESRGEFYEWLVEHRKISIDEWMLEHTEDYFNKLKDLMILLESNGVKTKILSWEPDYLDLIQSDVWVYNRFIPIEYRGKHFNNIREMMKEHRHLTINSDYDNFENPPKDHHPSKECHEVIAQSVIKSIQKDLDNKENSYVIDKAYEDIKHSGNFKLPEYSKSLKKSKNLI